MRRGDVRAGLLIALLDGPGHGYELIQRIEAKADGRWRPSPGSVYPSLQALADQDLVTSSEHDGKRVFELTDAGRSEADERIASSGLPWDDTRNERGELHTELRGLHLAAKQAVVIGSPETHAQAAAILRDARKAIYRLLADS
jgi:DNA-binding PadR family transcriptional regulator